jgi:hypothetical protein
MWLAMASAWPFFLLSSVAWCCRGRGQAINLMGGIKPDLTQVQVRRPNIVVDRFSRPLETLFRHSAVFRRRFHGNAPQFPDI